MSIFTRSPAPQQTAPAADAPAQKGQPARTTDVSPPSIPAQQAAAPGVVPPPAAPIYSMRPPEPVQRADVARSAEKPKVTTDAQVTTRVEVDAAVRRARATTPATSLSRQVQTSQQRRAATIAMPTEPARQGFDPSRAAQAGLLNLAWKWQEAGSPIRAIHAYMELLCRYPDSAGAEAAVADLVALSDKLTEQGQFHTALAIYDQLEELLA
jgi:hypothetical protein